MKLFGVTLFEKRAPAGASPVGGSGSGGWRSIMEPFTGAWQQNVEWKAKEVTAYAPVYACISRIAQDVGKLRVKLVKRGEDGI